MPKEKIKQKSKDGPGGFLAKNSDLDGNLVIVLPGQFKKKFKRVVIISKDGQKEKLRYTGKANPDSAGERQHWRGNNPIQTYGNKAKVIAHQNTVKYIWILRGVKSGRVD